MLKFTLLLISFLIACPTIYGQVHFLKEEFNNQKVTGSGEILHPTSIRFDNSGIGYITLKRGIVRLLDTTGVLLPNPLIDISEEVVGDGDHGLVSIALDPNFENNGYFYLLYSVDRHHLLHFGTSNYDASITIEKQATIGRITRFQADRTTNFTTTLSDSRKVLVGKDIADLSFPILMSSHGLGSLIFGEDGTLMASCGDAGSFQAADLGSSEHTYFEQALADGILREKDNVGAFRAQLVDNLAGKIIRVDPFTGAGIPSNPFYDAVNPTAPKSRVWSLGFRNPFRFILAPGTGNHSPMAGQPGDLFVGDVGSGRWEEMSIVKKGGQNFGWPLFEGFAGGWEFWPHRTSNYDAPNPCTNDFFSFQELLKEEREDQEYTFLNPCDIFSIIPPEIPTFVHTRPVIAWSNTLWNKPTRAEIPAFDSLGQATPGKMSDIGIETPEFDGFSSMPGFFYSEGDFPEELHHSLFVSDFSGWIKTFHFNEQDELIDVKNFMDRDTGIVDLELNVKDGCLYYIHFNSHSVNKICFGGTPPPIAAFQIDEQYGMSPLTVEFNGAASYDPTNLGLSYKWDFGDGTFSTESNPTHIFEVPTNEPSLFEVLLTVTNSAGLMATERKIISPNNTPPKVRISSINKNGWYPSNDITYLKLAAEVADKEHSDEQLSYKWQTFFHHNTHFHEEPQLSDPTTAVILESTDCSTSEVFWHRFKLTVTDEHGLSASDEVELFPYCEADFFELKNLTAKGTEQVIDLSWEAISEQDLIRYDIQRTKDFRFETIGSVPANSNKNYTYVDTDPILGRNYYRVMGVRSDDAFEYSDQTNIHFPAEPEVVSVYPNPVSVGLTVFTKYPIAETLNFELYDPIGKLVYTTTWDAIISEPIEKRINLRPFSNGIYFYKVRNGESEVEGKLLLLKK